MRRRSTLTKVSQLDEIFAFKVKVTPEALQVAWELHALLGPPPSPLPHSLDETCETPTNPDEAKRKWNQVLENLVESGRSPSKVRRVLSPLKAVEWDGRNLTLEGPLSMEVFELLENQTLCRFCFVVG